MPDSISRLSILRYSMNYPVNTDLMMIYLLVLLLSTLILGGSVGQALFPGGEWPEGTFGLMQPVTGCPDGYFWKTGYRGEIFQLGEQALRCEQQSCHFKGHELWKYQWVQTFFCIKQHPETLRPWPNGSYCVNMYSLSHTVNTCSVKAHTMTKCNHFNDEGCPAGFKAGFIQWDADNMASDENVENGTLPTGIYNEDTLIMYCCRDDGNPLIPIELPTGKPFYLYLYKNRCQNVKGMTLTQESIFYRTKMSYFLFPNIDAAGCYHPSCSLNPIILRLCYYEPENLSANHSFTE